jgi:signal transduction histidine kinase
MTAMSTGAESDATSRSASPAGRRWRWTLRDSGATPRSIIWAARAFGFIWIGLLTFIAQAQADDRSDLGLQIGGYAIIGVAMLVWSMLDRRSPAGPSRNWWLPATLGVIAAVSGVLAMSHNGALLVLFAAIAALVAGADTALGSALAVVGVGILGALVGALAFGANAVELIGYPVTMASGLLIGRQRRTYRMQAEQAAELLVRTRQLQVQQRRADVLDERTRIAREIHDVLAHSLGGLGIQIQAARAVLTDSGDVDKALDVLATAQRMASDGLVETRRAVHALRSDTLALDQELRNIAGWHTSKHRSTVEVTVDGTPRDLPPTATMALLRVAQEGLVNAAKHAPRQRVEIRLAYKPDCVRLTVSNPVGDGTVVDPAFKTADSGYGLTGMKERLLLIGGTLSVGRRRDTWTVDAEVPDEPVPVAATPVDDPPEED